MGSGRPRVQLNQNWNLVFVSQILMLTLGPSELGWGSFRVRSQLLGVPVLRLWLPDLALGTCIQV